MEFEDKIALITGSSGIGLAAALHLARSGAHVHLCGVDEAHNARAATTARGLSMTVHQADVSNETEVKEVINAVVASAPGIDILVNAAGIQTYGTIESTDTAHWDKVMAVNLRACYLTSHYAYPHMKMRGGGSIVHVASVQGHANQYGVLAYATAKGAMHALTRAMAVDCAKDKIRVNSISPGSIRTPLLEYGARQLAGDGQTMEDMITMFGKAHPIGRVGTAEEVAELIAFLTSDRSQFCTGGDYRIDGGLTAHLGV